MACNRAWVEKAVGHQNVWHISTKQECLRQGMVCLVGRMLPLHGF